MGGIKSSLCLHRAREAEGKAVQEQWQWNGVREICEKFAKIILLKFCKKLKNVINIKKAYTKKTKMEI